MTKQQHRNDYYDFTQMGVCHEQGAWRSRACRPHRVLASRTFLFASLGAAAHPHGFAACGPFADMLCYLLMSGWVQTELRLRIVLRGQLRGFKIRKWHKMTAGARVSRASHQQHSQSQSHSDHHCGRHGYLLQLLVRPLHGA